MSKREGSVAVCRCHRTHGLYGIRIERINGEWQANWSFKLKEQTARQEGYGEQLINDFRNVEGYPGCPCCKTQGRYVVCECGKLTSCCDVNNGAQFTCEWCGMTGILSAYDGSGIKTGGDI